MPTLDHLNRKTKKQDKTEQKPFLNWVDKKNSTFTKQANLFIYPKRKKCYMYVNLPLLFAD